VSASANYNALFDSCSDLINAFKELKLANAEFDRLKHKIYDEQGNEQDEWEASIELVKNAPIKIVKQIDKEICITPVNESDEVAIESVKKVKQIYSRIKVINELKQKGYDKVKEQKLPDGSIRVVVQKWQ